MLDGLQCAAPRHTNDGTIVRCAGIPPLFARGFGPVKSAAVGDLTFTGGESAGRMPENDRHDLFPVSLTTSRATITTHSSPSVPSAG